MDPRYIDANALINYSNNQIDKKIGANEIARFPTAIDIKWHYPQKCKDDLPVLYEYVVAMVKDKYDSVKPQVVFMRDSGETTEDENGFEVDVCEWVDPDENEVFEESSILAWQYISNYREVDNL